MYVSLPPKSMPTHSHPLKVSTQNPLHSLVLWGRKPSVLLLARKPLPPQSMGDHELQSDCGAQASSSASSAVQNGKKQKLWLLKYLLLVSTTWALFHSFLLLKTNWTNSYLFTELCWCPLYTPSNSNCFTLGRSPRRLKDLYLVQTHSSTEHLHTWNECLSDGLVCKVSLFLSEHSIET